ncbi:patatin-like phospholipase family protein [Myxococcota bacterium]|nr:patatin-like phospholipase family protein [Myxococcota bacterium]
MDLFVVERGLVTVQMRSGERRAPVTVVLGPGGLFGESALAGQGLTSAVACAESHLLRLPVGALARLSRETPWVDPDVHADDATLEDALRRLALVRGRMSWIIDQLRRSPLLRNVPPALLYPLLEGAELREGFDHQHLHAADAAFEGLGLVLSGEVILQLPAAARRESLPEAPRPIIVGAGATFGESCLARPGPLGFEVSAGGDGCEFLLLRADVFQAELQHSPGLRRAVFSAAVLGDPERRSLAGIWLSRSDARRHANEVAVVSDRPVPGLGTLIRWLAASAGEDWGDRVLVIQVDSGGARSPEDVRPVADLESSARLLRLHPEFVGPCSSLERARAWADTVYLDLGALDPATCGLWLRKAGRTLYLATSAWEPIPAWVMKDVVRPPIYTAVLPSPPPRPDRPRVVPVAAVRVDRTLLDAARTDCEWAHLNPLLRAQVGRWMRAVTQRRVGVALNGGGALAYAHVALLAELHRQGVPVDLVAGVSGGAVIGAYYAAGRQLGLACIGRVPKELRCVPELALAIEDGPRILRAAHPLRTVISSASLADFIDRRFQDLLLEDLLIPFLPVCTDIDLAVQSSLHVGPIGFGVRASGALPGPFTPATLDRRERVSWRTVSGRRRQLPVAPQGGPSQVRLVDGGVLNNLPDDTCYLEGAQVVVASQVVPPPSSRAEGSDPRVIALQERLGRGSGRLARFARELHPVLRLDDLLRAALLMMHEPPERDGRRADARFQAHCQGFFVTDWGRGEAIWRQQESGPAREALQAAVDDAARRYSQLGGGPAHAQRGEELLAQP